MNGLDKHEPDPADRLDDLLRQARWPAAAPERVSRLAGHWSELVFPSPRFRSARRYCLAAAICLVAVGAATWAFWREEAGSPRSSPKIRVAAKPPATGPGDDGARQALVDPDGSAAPKAESPSKQLAEGPPPAPADARPAARKTRVAKQDEMRRQVMERLDQALGAAGDDPAVDIDRLAAPFLAATAMVERPLIEIALDGEHPRRSAAARLLCRVATRQSRFALGMLAAEEAFHREAVQGLARLAGDAELNWLLSVEHDRELRAELLAAMLARNSIESAGYFLRIVQNPDASDEALAAIDRVTRFPTELLFSFLRGSLQRDRVAAARVLARSKDPAVVQALIAEAEWGVARREAIGGLLESSHPAAREYLKRAEQDVVLATMIGSAARTLGRQVE